MRRPGGLGLSNYHRAKRAKRKHRAKMKRLDEEIWRLQKLYNLKRKLGKL